jgi:AcrR family transcriptional regulator
MIKTSKQGTAIRQASLIDAALTLAALHVPADITTADLAHAVGITQGAVFRHFVNKQALWLAALDWVSQTLMTRLQAAIKRARKKSPAALPVLQAVFLSHVTFILKNPGVPRLIFQELQHSDDTELKLRVRALMAQYRQLVFGLLQQAHQQQELRPDIDLQAATLLFLGSVQGMVMQALVSNNLKGIATQAPEVYRIYQYGVQLLPQDCKGCP